jgi:hypothetical protein
LNADVHGIITMAAKLTRLTKIFGSDFVVVVAFALIVMALPSEIRAGL